MVNNSGNFNDKNWTVCDNSSSSPFFGNCYTEFDNASKNDTIQMSTSTDGGATWGAARPPRTIRMASVGNLWYSPTGP